jgi:hypothetical protein
MGLATLWFLCQAEEKPVEAPPTPTQYPLKGNSLLTAIPEEAFEGCKSLASVVIPDSVTNMDANVNRRIYHEANQRFVHE